MMATFNISKDVYDTDSIGEDSYAFISWLQLINETQESTGCENVQNNSSLEPKDIVGPVLLCILTAFGILGNLALFVVILYTPQMRTAANILIINLTIGDLFYIVCTAPAKIEHELFPCFNQPLWACKVLSFLPIVGQGGCVYSLAALSRERYNAIVHGIQTRQRSGKLRNILTVCLVWLVSIISGIPVLYTAYMPDQQMCIDVPPFTNFARAYATYRFLFLYLIPLLVIAAYYSRMARTLFMSVRGFADNSTGTHQTEARRRLAFIILIIIVFFGLFWFPFYVYLLWYQFSFVHYPKFEEFPAVNFFRVFHHIMALINSCLDPWCVFVISSSHRKRLLKCLFCGKFGKKESSLSPTQSPSSKRQVKRSVTRGSYTKSTSL